MSRTAKTDVERRGIGLPNRVPPHPFLSSGEGVVHADAYSSDVGDMPGVMGIDPEVVCFKDDDNHLSLIFSDPWGHSLVPYQSGIAIQDLSVSGTKPQGAFIPREHDGGDYALQKSYLYVDNRGNVVAPTDNGRLLVLRPTEDDGRTILDPFRKLADIPVVDLAQQALGDGCLDGSLLSAIPDWEGNVWFASGGISVFADDYHNGFAGYLDARCMERILAGDVPEDFAPYLHFTRFEGVAGMTGEAVENGISASPEGVVVLTNLHCYLLRAGTGGVERVWQTPYRVTGVKRTSQTPDITGGCLAWGGGSTPTLANDLIFFTDNAPPLRLLALERTTGNIVAQTELFAQLPADTQTAVDNSIIVYAPDESTNIVVAGNTFGLGNADFKSNPEGGDPQTAAVIFDPGFVQDGNCRIEPGLVRVDVLRDKGGAYTSDVCWSRPDIRNSSVVRLSSASGILYFYDQEPKTDEWRFHAASLETGETLFTTPVGVSGELNCCGGVTLLGEGGNRVSMPTGRGLLSWRDRFARLPDRPEERLDAARMTRRRPDYAGATMGYLTACEVDTDEEAVRVEFVMNGLDGRIPDLYCQTAAGYERLTRSGSAAPGTWSIRDGGGGEPEGGELRGGEPYALSVVVAAGSKLDSSPRRGTVRVAVQLVLA